MAEPDDQAPPASREEQWDKIAEALTKGAFNGLLSVDSGKMVVATTQDVLGGAVALALKLMTPIGLGFARGVSEAEDALAPHFSSFAAAAVSDIFGVAVSPSAFSSARGGAARNDGGAALGAGLLNIMRGQGAALQPTEQPAARYVSAMAGMALEDWYKGWFFELVSSLVPQIDIGKIENFGSLGDKVANVLGLAGVSRRVFRPIVDATIITPLSWQTNKTYRPQLLTASVIANQIARGKWSREQGVEELARQGYSDDRIDALLTNATKGHTIADLQLLVQAGLWSEGSAVAHLGDQGIPADVAKTEFQIEMVKDVAGFERSMANAAVDAFVAGRVTEGEMGGFLTGATIDGRAKAQLTELAHARRILNRRPLTSSEVERAVKAKILRYGDYRAALVREGRDDEAVTVLELLLRHEIDAKEDIEEHKRRQAEERAAEKAKRDAERAAKKAAVEAQRALQRRGAEADLERAVVRGLIPISRLEEVYAARYDADTVGLLLELVTDDRLAYVESLRQREEAAKRVPVRRAEIGDLEDAYMRGIITLGEYSTRLAQLHVDGGDIAILAGTLEARKRDADAAAAKRAQAEEAAKSRRANLNVLEQLVRRGHRSLGEYDRTLADWGFDDASRAAIVELLQLRIDDDARARQARADADARLRARGLSLEQFRRAVLLNVQTLDQFQTFLVENGFTADAQLVLLAELRADVEAAEAARARRDAAEKARGARAIPVGDVARAARLGLIAPQTYFDRLARDGYSADDIAIESDLLVYEMAETAAARARRDAADAAAAAKGVPLPTVARRVKAKLDPIGAYTSAAVAAGFTIDAAEQLTELLQAELDAIDAAEQRRHALAARQPSRDLSLSQLEGAAVDDLIDVETFAAEVARLGYDADEVELLVAMLVQKIDAAALDSGGAES